jgi:hypothetical protein
MRRKLDPEISGGSRFASLCPCLLVLPHRRCSCLPGRPIALHSLSTEWCGRRPSSTMLAAGQSRASTLAAARRPLAERNPHLAIHICSPPPKSQKPTLALAQGLRECWAAGISISFRCVWCGRPRNGTNNALGQANQIISAPSTSSPTYRWLLLLLLLLRPRPGRALIVPRPTERSFGVHGMGRAAGGMGSSSPGPNAGTCPGIPPQSQHACILHPAHGEPS